MNFPVRTHYPSRFWTDASMGKVEKWEKECLPSNYLPRASLEEKYLQMANGQFRATDHYELCVRIQSRCYESTLHACHNRFSNTPNLLHENGFTTINVKLTIPGSNSDAVPEPHGCFIGCCCKPSRGPSWLFWLRGNALQSHIHSSCCKR